MDTDIPDKGHSLYHTMPQINTPSAEVLKLLSNLNPHKTCRPDNINGRVLNELNEEVTLESGEIHKDWKHANVAPAFKKVNI